MVPCIQCREMLVDEGAVLCTSCEEEYWDDPGVVPNTFDADEEEDDPSDAHGDSAASR